MDNIVHCSDIYIYITISYKNNSLCDPEQSNLRKTYELLTSTCMVADPNLIGIRNQLDDQL